MPQWDLRFQTKKISHRVPLHAPWEAILKLSSQHCYPPGASISCRIGDTYLDEQVADGALVPWHPQTPPQLGLHMAIPAIPPLHQHRPRETAPESLEPFHLAQEWFEKAQRELDTNLRCRRARLGIW